MELPAPAGELLRGDMDFATGLKYIHPSESDIPDLVSYPQRLGKMIMWILVFNLLNNNYVNVKKTKRVSYKKQRNTRWNKHRVIFSFSLKKVVFTLLVSAILSYAFIKIVRSAPYLSTWFGLIADATPNWYMDAYYNTVNSQFVHKEEIPDIVILNINEQRTRQDIADLLEIVSEASPKAVGVDITFSPSKRFDSIQTINLIHTIERIQQKVSFPIVYAYALGEKTIIPDSLMQKLNIGYVDFSGYYRYQIEQEGIPHFTALLASLAHYDVSSLDTASFLVNYRTKKINDRYIVVGDFREGNEPTYIANLVKDKIVLIGGTTHRTDKHATPFIVDKEIDNEKEKFAGTTEIAYALSSVICSTYTKEDWKKIEYKNIFHPYKKGIKWIDAIITILFILLYLLLYIIIDHGKEKYKNMELLKPILLLIMVALSVGVSMIITANWYYVPNVFFLMVMTAFIGASYDGFKLLLK